MDSWNSIFKELKSQMEQIERDHAPFPSITYNLSIMPLFSEKLSSNTLNERDLINFIVEWGTMFYNKYNTYPRIIIGTSRIELGKDRTRKLREPKDWIDDIKNGFNDY